MLPYEIPNLHRRVQQALKSSAIDGSQVILSAMYASTPPEPISELAAVFEKYGDFMEGLNSNKVWSMLPNAFTHKEDYKGQMGAIITETQLIIVNRRSSESFFSDAVSDISTFLIEKTDNFSVQDFGYGWFNVIVSFTDGKQASFAARSPQHNQAIEILKQQKATLLQASKKAAPPASPVNIAEQLEKLAELHRQQVITDQEFAAAKKRLLQ